MTSSLFIRTIAGNRGLRCILSQQLLLNLLRKLCELRRILRIRSPSSKLTSNGMLSSKLTSNGMLSNSRNRCNHPKSGALRNVLQLYERVLKRAVSVYTNQNSPSPVAAHHTQPISHHSRDSTGIRRHRDYGHVVLSHRDSAEI